MKFYIIFLTLICLLINCDRCFGNSLKIYLSISKHLARQIWQTTTEKPSINSTLMRFSDNQTTVVFNSTSIIIYNNSNYDRGSLITLKLIFTCLSGKYLNLKHSNKFDSLEF
jgi:hypothetical protein